MEPLPRREIVVGIISDTHGLLRPEAIGALRGVDVIVHAGDIGNPEIIEELRGIAPTCVVRGNIDTGKWAADLPMIAIVEVGELKFFVLHQISQLAFDPVTEGYAAVVFGHSHAPLVETRQGVLFLNPGSAGPRRFKLPVTVARARVSGRRIHPEIVQLPV
jgi:putative phosphoesterase